MTKKTLLKDAVNHSLTQRGVNVASFISFGPDGKQRFACVRGISPDTNFSDYKHAVEAMYATDYIELVNIRTFLPDKPDGNPFLPGAKHGFSDPAVAAEAIADHVKQGYHVIVNENIDPSDGGFSGVAMGDSVEFAACDIPRCVDKEEDVPCAALSRSLTRRLVREVYGFNLVFPFPSTWRVEFSVHPGPSGYFGEKLTIWQAEEMPVGALQPAPPPVWPNRYSIYLSDKAFGLLMADLHDFPVPYTKVFGRVIPPFSFGTEVHSGEGDWIRTCPRQQEPGLYTTKRGYMDPFALMEREDPPEKSEDEENEEDPRKRKIAAIIVQQGIKPGYSGAAITGHDGKAIIEGKAGRGDVFMTGCAPSQDLPRDVASAITSLWFELSKTFGTVRFEWVFDNYRKQPWIIQLHGGKSESVGDIIYPGEAITWHDFKVPGDLEKLRALSKQAQKENAGIRLLGNIGITSHPADILRRDKVPSRLCRKV